MTPRDASELVPALESTWTIVEECLDRWTPDMLQDEFPREINRSTPDAHAPVSPDAADHPRRLPLWRDRAGAGMHGLREVDIWTVAFRPFRSPPDKGSGDVAVVSLWQNGPLG